MVHLVVAVDHKSTYTMHMINNKHIVAGDAIDIAYETEQGMHAFAAIVHHVHDTGCTVHPVGTGSGHPFFPWEDIHARGTFKMHYKSWTPARSCPVGLI